MPESENPYLLLTPGPLSTSRTVKDVMLRDWCTWDDDYNQIVQQIRSAIVNLAAGSSAEYTSVLMQGSGTFSVESVIGSVMPKDSGKLLVLANGAYGKRLATISSMLHLNHLVLDWGDTGEVIPEDVERILESDSFTHLVMVHCETTTGMLNPIEQIGEIAQKYALCFIVDAMSSFGGIPIDMEQWGIDFLISSANKCIQGVPGFGFVVAKRESMENIKGFARSHSLDLHDQWKTMETANGKWRFTSPTHVVRAFRQALLELDEEGGIENRHQRYTQNQKQLVAGFRKIGFQTLLDDRLHSPIITTFLSPDHPEYDFKKFYNHLKARGFVIYPGKVTEYNCFRVGNIGEVYSTDIDKLVEAASASMYWV
ncbi:MAG: 2-aminoethylphosphonate--pyruvate transaminase [Balneolaceae bacterium]|nr:MAG: 2-aminoethylphosphonate--pyruvate transaminase [Balneolaceae bacterium]